MVPAAALDQQLNDLLAHSGVLLFYLAVWALVFAGTGLLIGLFIPFITGDSLLFAAGLIAAVASGVNIWLLAPGVAVAAFAGNMVGYMLGKRLGRPYLDRRAGPRMQKFITKTDSFYRAWGWWSVLISRFMPWARVLIPVIAGISRMSQLKFTTASAAGAVLWGAGITLTGYFAAHIPAVKSVAYVIAALCIVASLIAAWRAWRYRDPMESEATTGEATSVE